MGDTITQERGAAAGDHSARLQRDREAVAYLHSQGLPVKEIARKVGRYPATVRRWIDSGPLPVQRQLTTAEDQQIADMYRRGVSSWDIVIALKISEPTVYASLHRSGVPVPQTHRAKGVDTAELVAAFREDPYMSRTAQRFGINEGTVRHHLEKAAAHLPPPAAPLTDSDHERIAALRRRRLGVLPIAVVLGVSCEAIEESLDRSGLLAQPDCHPKGLDRAEVVAAYKADPCLSRVAARLGVCPAVVVFHLNKAGVNRDQIKQARKSARSR